MIFYGILAITFAEMDRLTDLSVPRIEKTQDSLGLVSQSENKRGFSRKKGHAPFQRVDASGTSVENNLDREPDQALLFHDHENTKHLLEERFHDKGHTLNSWNSAGKDLPWPRQTHHGFFVRAVSESEDDRARLNFLGLTSVNYTIIDYAGTKALIEDGHETPEWCKTIEAAQEAYYESK